MDLTAVIAPAARGLLYATGAIWLVLELRQTTNYRPEATKADRGSRMVIRLSTAVGVGGAIAALRVSAASIRPASVPAYIGLVVLWGGIALRFWSFHTLGRYFTFTVQTSDDQPVIKSGPYRVIRHPSYTGVLLAVIGIGLFMANWLSLVVLTLAVLCGLSFRIHVEEGALLKELGETYRTYAATHKRLIPFIW